MQLRAGQRARALCPSRKAEQLAGGLGWEPWLAGTWDFAAS